MFAPLPGVHLLPSTGEFTYDPLPYLGARVGGSLTPINAYAAPGGGVADYSTSMNQLQAAHPECGAVSIVCSWFANAENAASCQIYPSTTYIGGTFQQASGASDLWRVSGLNQNSPGLIPIPSNGGSFIYGGTPCDASIVRCIRDLRSRGLKVIFYPFLLMTAPGLPWRGRIGYSPDLTAAASAAVAAFLGGATTAQFTPDPVHLTVAYSGSPTDYSYRRMILHYAALCALAGGVDLFVIGSELRGLETIRGPGWTPAGATDANGFAIWDYPFVAGLTRLAADVRAIFDAKGLTRNAAASANLITYSADWSVWMGYQHPGANGQWPHLDSLYASPNIDLVCFDNYLPLSDWTTGAGGLDAANWRSPAPSGAWPPSPATMSGLGLSGAPQLASLAYLMANIEGGEKFNWFYYDGANGGPQLDPSGSDLVVSQPQGDRAAQARNPYYPNQQLLANKQLRWWWNHPHRAIYVDSSGGWNPQGPPTPWSPQSKSIAFLEYGFPACDKGTNQPNLFYDAASSESGTPYWSIWDPAPGGGYIPRRDDTLPSLALQAIYQYWSDSANNETSANGVVMVQMGFSCVWNWDARPFPVFPLYAAAWGDAGNWAAGNWINGRGPALPPVAASPDPTPGSYLLFPQLATLGWSVHITPRFATDIADHVSGRAARRARRAVALYNLELTYEVLRADAAHLELQTLAGFFESVGGADAPFWIAPPGLSAVAAQALGTGDGVTTSFALMRAFGGYSEPVAGASGVTAVYLDGVAQASGWSVSPGYGPALTFVSAPAAGVAVAADFNALWLCRFAADTADFENFQSLLWNFRTVKLQTVRP